MQKIEKIMSQYIHYIGVYQLPCRLRHDEDDASDCGAAWTGCRTPALSSVVSSSPDWCTVAQTQVSVSKHSQWQGKEGRERTAEHDIATADEFAIEVDLRDGGPLAVLLDALPELLVFQTVVCSGIVAPNASIVS